MLADAQILQNAEDISHFDILYSHNKKKGGIDFSQFIEQLPSIISNSTEKKDLR